MANILGYVPFRIIADILAQFQTYYRSPSWAWPSATQTERVKEIREAPNSDGDTWRDVGSIFNDILTNTDNTASNTLPALTLGDFTEMDLEYYNGTTWVALPAYSTLSGSTESTQPQVRIATEAGVARMTAGTDGTSMTYASGNTADSAVNADDKIQLLAADFNADTPSAGTVATDALRINLTINQD